VHYADERPLDLPVHNVLLLRHSENPLGLLLLRVLLLRPPRGAVACVWVEADRTASDNREANGLAVFCF